jgi:hypothetical protein
MEGLMRIRSVLIPAAIAGLGLLLAASGEGCKETPRKQVTVVDGVEVVANPAMPLRKNPGRVLKVREKLRIRDTGDTFYFKGPGSPEIAPDGSVIIKQIGQLLRFSQEGVFLGNLIKPGQGPGEIEMPLGYLIEGDGVRLVDGSVNKIVHLTLEGRYLDERRLDQEVQVLTRGWYVGLQSFWPRVSGVLADMPHNFVCAPRPDGTAWKKYTFLGKYYQNQSVHFPWDTPRWVADAGRDLIFISLSRKYGIKVLDLNAGRVTRSFSRDYPSLPYVVPPKAKAIYAQAGVPTPDHSDDVLELFLPDANLWVRTSTIDAEKGQLFDVFSAEGDFLDSFYVLVKGKILGIRGDTVITSEEAEDGTIAVVLYQNLEYGRD